MPNEDDKLEVTTIDDPEYEEREEQLAKQSPGDPGFEEELRKFVNFHYGEVTSVVPEATTEELKEGMTDLVFAVYEKHDKPIGDQNTKNQIEEMVNNQIDALRQGVANTNIEPDVKSIQTAADPVTLFNGEFVHEAVDLVIDGAGVDFVFKRVYKNQAAYLGSLGHNWDHGYNLWLRVVNQTIFRSTGALREEAFKRHPRFGEAGFDYWTPPDGQHGVIIENDNSFIWRATNGVRHFYEQSVMFPFLHRIARMEDKFGNYISLVYDEDNMVKIEVNHPERIVTLQYDSENRIIAIQDFTNRRWQYCYDDFGDLVTVTTPGTESYEEGLTVSYEYSSAQFSGALQHNLTRIIDAESQLFLENEYGTQSGDLSFNRVIRQRQGAGERFFEYADVIQEFEFDYNDQNRPAHQTTLVERNGQEIQHIFNRLGNLISREECILSNGMSRRLQWRYRYNRDGVLRAILTPEGRMTQYLYGREFFLRRQGLDDNQDISQNDELTFSERQSFGRLLAIVYRARSFGLEELNLSQGVWGDLFPDIFAPLDTNDIVLKFTYEDTYGQPLTISDPRFTDSPDPEHAESTDYENTLTRFSYRGPFGDPTLFIDSIEHPTPTLPDGTSGDAVIEQFSEHDDHGRLLRYINAVGTVFEFSYFDSSDGNLEGYLSKIAADSEGLALTTEYTVDDLGRTVEIRLPRAVNAPAGEFTVKQEFNNLDQLVRTISPKPFEYQVSRFYDRNGNVVRTVNDAKDEKDENIPGAPQVQTLTYDEDFNLIQSTVGGADISEHLVTRHCYNPSGNRVQTTLARGNQVYYFYDERMQPVAAIRGFGTPEAATHRAEYDGDGRLVRIIDPRGFATATSYDAFNNVVAVEDALGNIVHRSYDKLGNLLIERVFERREDNSLRLMARSQFEYDELGRLIREGQNLFEQPLPVESVETDFLESPGPGRLLITQNFYDSGRRVVKIVDPLRRESLSEYDALDRLMRITDPLGNRIENHFDEHGNLIRQDVRELMRDPATDEITGEQVFSTTNAFDELDRRVVKTDSLGNATRFLYDSRGKVLESIDPLGNVIRKTYDIYGRLIKDILEQTTTGLGEGLPLEPIETDYEYDANCNLLAVIDGLGRRTAQRYDALDRLIATIYPDNQRTSFTYDACGNLVNVKDNNGLQRKYTIDSLGRVSGVTVDRSALNSAVTIEGSETEAYGYDALGRQRFAENEFARCESTFNSLGWPLSETLHFTTPEASFAEPLILSRAFDDVAALTQLVYPNGRTLHYERDALNRLLRIDSVSNGNNYPGHPETPDVHNIIALEYAGRRRSACRFGNGASIAYIYDGGGAPIEISHRSHDEDLLTIQYLHDGAGNPRLRNDIGPAAASGVRLLYDSAYRLADVEPIDDIEAFDADQLRPAQELPPDPLPNRQAEIDLIIGSMALLAPGGKTFAYDPLGNRQLEQGTEGGGLTYTVNELNQYTEVNGTSFSYDFNGNLISDGVRDYFYDAQNRLARVADAITGEQIVRFFYDARGRRVLEIRGLQARHLIHNGPNVVAEYQDGLPFAHYVHDAGIDRPVQIAAEESEHWYHPDLVGSTRLLTGRNGDARAQYDYAPFGNTLGDTPADAPYNPFLYTARRFDAELGLYDYRLRQYDPNLGRFLQRDPSGMADGPNLYAYAGNNPVAFVDPFGTERQERREAYGLPAMPTTGRGSGGKGPTLLLTDPDEEMRFVSPGQRGILAQEVDPMREARLAVQEQTKRLRSRATIENLTAIINRGRNRSATWTAIWAASLFSAPFVVEGLIVAAPSSFGYATGGGGLVESGVFGLSEAGAHIGLGVSTFASGSKLAALTVAGVESVLIADAATHGVPIDLAMPSGPMGKTSSGSEAATGTVQAVNPDAPSEAIQRVRLIERMQQIVDEGSQVANNAIALGDRAALGEYLYPKEINAILNGKMVSANQGTFIEWRSRQMFALDPLVGPHVGGGGYLGRRHVVGKGPRRAFADFFGTEGGLLSGIAIDVTTNAQRVAHLARGYLEKGLVLTY